jgi:type I restriction enzyme S subunit
MILFGDHTRIFKFLDFPFVVGADGTKLLQAAKGVDPLFLFYALRALGLPNRGYNRHFSLLREQILLIPESAPSQIEIASLLSALENALKVQSEIAACLVRLRTAMMSLLFRNGLNGEPLKKTEIGLIPESWCIGTCEDLCDPVTVGIVVTPAKYYVSEGIPCFRSFNIKPNRLATHDLVFISPEANELHIKSKIKTGDVLIVRTGYPGTACVVPPEYDGANCIDLLIARPKVDAVDSGFLAGYLNSPEGKSQVAQQQGGLAQQHYNVGALRRLLVPLPRTEEQHEIAARLSLLEQRLIAAETRQAALQDLFTTMLRRLRDGTLLAKDHAYPEVANG